MEKKRERWIFAFQKFEKNVNSNVLCPECEKAYLKAKDETIAGTNKIERFIFCENCGSWNTIIIDSEQQL